MKTRKSNKHAKQTNAMCVCGCVGGELKINLIMATEKEGKSKREMERYTHTLPERKKDRKLSFALAHF